jgi:drug/metabolite transporter (DMT)-like permease
LAAAAVHASLHLIIKRGGSRPGGALPFLWMTFAVVGVAMGPAFVASLAHGEWIPRPAQRWLLLSIVAESVYYVGLSRAYGGGPLSRVYPTVRGTGVMLTPVVATLVLGESPSALGGVAIGCIAIGLLLPRLLAPVEAGATERPGWAWSGDGAAFVAGMAMSVYLTADRAALRTSPLVPYLYLDITCCAIVLAPLLVGRRADLRSVWRDDRRNLLIASAATIASGVLVLAALARGPAAYVAAARETSILFATALGAWLLRERVGRWQVAGLGCVAVGLVLIALVA